MKATQLFLIQIKKQAAVIKKRRAEELYAKLASLEAKIGGLSQQEVKDIAEIKAHIRIAEEQQAKSLQVYLKGWWKEREDRPVKEIFKTLKRKQDYEQMPMLESPEGVLVGSEEDNKRLIQDHFSNLFAQPPSPSAEKRAAIREVERCRRHVASEQLALQLEERIEVWEIEEAIKALKVGKSPDLDDLPAEFFQQFMESDPASLPSVGGGHSLQSFAILH